MPTDARARRSIVVLTVATLAVLAPFCGKAFHIDDTMYVWIAQHIRRKWGDPYGFNVVWYFTSASVSTIQKNPPLSSYAIAIWSIFAGWSEHSLHALMAIPAVATVVGTWRLARGLGAAPRVAALATLAAPGFVVSASTVMCDVSMLALWTWALVFWTEGIHGIDGKNETDGDDLRRLSIAAILAGLAGLTKYFGICLLPLLLAHGLIARRRVGRWMLPLALTVAILAAYQTWTAHLYGRGLIFDAADYATNVGGQGGSSAFARAVVGLAFVGGCVPIALLAAPLAWGRRAIVVVIVATLVFSLFPLVPVFAPGPNGELPSSIDRSLVVQLAIFVVAGVTALVLVVDELRRAPRDANVWLLAMWIVGTLLFATVVNWTVNARAILPMTPAVAILAARAIHRRALSPRVIAVPIALSLAVALAVAWGDMQLANTDRDAVARLLRDPDRGATWYEGHWGFQYYLDRAGARPLDVDGVRPAPGDRVLIPMNNTNTFPLPPFAFALESTIDLPIHSPVATMDLTRAAGFYVASWGRLPYSFGAPQPERFLVFRTRPPPGSR